MKILRQLVLVSLLLVFSGCGKKPAQPFSSAQQEPSSWASQASSGLEISDSPLTCEVYQQALIGDVVYAQWLSSSSLLWAIESQNEENTTYTFEIFDTAKGAADEVFEREVSANQRLDIAASLTDDQLSLYLSNNASLPIHSKVILHTENWKVVDEKELPYDDFFYLPYKSIQDIVLSQKSYPGRNPLFGLHPLDNPQQFATIQQTQETRYTATGIIWSPSGKYFMLRNLDAFGMDKFESDAELLGYPESERPVAMQFDVFNNKGEFLFSFAVDDVCRADGSNTTRDMYWIPDDQIYIASTFYDAALGTSKTTERLITSAGEETYKKTSFGERRYYSASNFVKDGALFSEVSDDGIHLNQLFFLTDETIDYGVIASKDALGGVLEYPHPDASYSLIIDRYSKSISVLKLEK